MHICKPPMNPSADGSVIARHRDSLTALGQALAALGMTTFADY